MNWVGGTRARVRKKKREDVGRRRHLIDDGSRLHQSGAHTINFKTRGHNGGRHEEASADAADEYLQQHYYRQQEIQQQQRYHHSHGARGRELSRREAPPASRGSTDLQMFSLLASDMQGDRVDETPITMITKLEPENRRSSNSRKRAKGSSGSGSDRRTCRKKSRLSSGVTARTASGNSSSRTRPHQVELQQTFSFPSNHLQDHHSSSSNSRRSTWGNDIRSGGGGTSNNFANSLAQKRRLLQDNPERPGPLYHSTQDEDLVVPYEMDPIPNPTVLFSPLPPPPLPLPLTRSHALTEGLSDVSNMGVNEQIKRLQREYHLKQDISVTAAASANKNGTAYRGRIIPATHVRSSKPEVTSPLAQPPTAAITTCGTVDAASGVDMAAWDAFLGLPGPIISTPATTASNSKELAAVVPVSLAVVSPTTPISMTHKDIGVQTDTGLQTSPVAVMSSTFIARNTIEACHVGTQWSPPPSSLSPLPPTPPPPAPPMPPSPTLPPSASSLCSSQCNEQQNESVVARDDSGVILCNKSSKTSSSSDQTNSEAEVVRSESETEMVD